MRFVGIWYGIIYGWLYELYSIVLVGEWSVRESY